MVTVNIPSTHFHCSLGPVKFMYQGNRLAGQGNSMKTATMPYHKSSSDLATPCGARYYIVAI